MTVELYGLIQQKRHCQYTKHETIDELRLMQWKTTLCAEPNKTIKGPMNFLVGLKLLPKEEHK